MTWIDAGTCCGDLRYFHDASWRTPQKLGGNIWLGLRPDEGECYSCKMRGQICPAYTRSGGLSK